MKRRCAQLEIENGKLREQIDEATGQLWSYAAQTSAAMDKIAELEQIIEELREALLSAESDADELRYG